MHVPGHLPISFVIALVTPVMSLLGVSPTYRLDQFPSLAPRQYFVSRLSFSTTCILYYFRPLSYTLAFIAFRLLSLTLHRPRNSNDRSGRLIRLPVDACISLVDSRLQRLLPKYANGLSALSYDLPTDT